MTARSPIDYLCLSSGSIIIIRLDLEEINSAIGFGRISDSLDLLQKSDREIYNRSKLNRSIMSYKQVENLKPTEFKRLCGVTPEI
ncbi:hypothetical protein, partial [Chamaesiphon sp.]|uniref:hypothetical protein n=1 Tax=Chamaesiphon sp. TaxID=2814140 RepID=UPI0035944CA6